MPGDWCYEQTRSLVGMWSQTNVQGERDGVTRNPEMLTHRPQIYTERQVASNVALGTQALSYNSWRN